MERTSRSRREKEKIDVSFVIVTWNSENEIGNCLSSIFSEVSCSFEAIVVDNASSDSTLEVIKKFPETKLIANSENLKFARGTNQGLQISQGKFKMLLNPDTILTKNSIEKLITFLEENEKVGAVAPKLLNLDKSIQPSCRRFPTFRTLFFEMFLLSRIFPKSNFFSSYKMPNFTHNETCEVDQPQGAALLVKNQVLEEIGLLDENFPMFFNDVDFCFRIKRAKWKIYFLAESEVLHVKGASIYKVRKKMIKALHESFFDYLKKHYPQEKLLLQLSKPLLYFTSKLRSVFV
ncbi:MAG: glycosyltransferase family 2 protein [Calditrichaeota bacterium]|nr:MAG: glycosyltransferase family 2 protein [Calditrichota bacterium]